MKKTISGKKLTFLLTLIYFTSYVTRINFAAIIQEVVTDTGFEKSALSVILVCLSVTYGFGQIINGRIGDKIKPENLILSGLIISTAVNLLFPLAASSIPFMCVLWSINGFAQAMMWPPMVKIMVGSMDEAMYSYAVVRVSWGSSIGTIAVYLTAPLIISLIGWRAVFIFSAAIGLTMSIIWALLKGRLASYEDKEISEDKAPAKFKFPKAAIFPMIFIALGIIFQGMLRDGVTSWMPSYLAEVAGFDNESSILSTVILAVFSIISFSVAGAAYKRFFKNEVACSVVIWILALVSSIALFFLFDKAVAAIIFMSLITGAMHGINLMLITHVPKRFKKYGNISTISGAINSCTYIGSAIFTYVVAVLAEKYGWQTTVGIWAVIAALGLICCAVAVKSWHKFSSHGE